jgi:hypothetical protein
MNKNQEIAIGTKLKYKGKDFAGFKHEHNEMTFLGYDSNGFYGIWVDYHGENKFLSIDDVELVDNL